VAQVGREENRGHATAAQLAIEAGVIGQAGRDPLSQIRHPESAMEGDEQPYRHRNPSQGPASSAEAVRRTIRTYVASPPRGQRDGKLA